MTAHGILARCRAALCAGCLAASAATAQPLTPDPTTWRPLSFVDLRLSSPATRTYADIWRDLIEANNRAYEARGDLRFRGANAPVTEAHFVIWSTSKSVVVSILNTATGCTLKAVAAGARASVKLCPLRLAIYEGIAVRTLEGGQACFLELAALAAGEMREPDRAAAYASYEPATKTIRLGLIIDHRPVDGCSHAIPLYPRS